MWYYKMNYTVIYERAAICSRDKREGADGMQQRKCRLLGVFLLLCLLCLTACGDASPDRGQGGFSCTAVNGQGESVRGFFAESDGSWYIPVPSHWNVAEVELRCTGTVTAASTGVLNQTAGAVSGPFAGSGDQTVLQTGDGTSVTVTVLQSQLPSVQIRLDGVTLEDIHADKSKKFRGTTVQITQADGTVDVQARNNVEMKGRGNSTWQLYEKKGYQIKFSGATAVLGMDAAEKWVLLANASDDSMVRNRLVYDAAQQMGLAFVPELEYVELWIDGDYRGTYLIGEKVEVGTSRLDLRDPLGTLFERDDAFYEDESCWVYNEYLDAYFVQKDSVSGKDELVQRNLDVFSAGVDRLMTYLYTTPSAEVTLRRLSEMIDVDSFAMYYLINEYTLNRESLSTSFYWYTDGTQDVLHLGPIWDFDTCMGNDGANYTDSYSHNSLLFRYLLAAPAFYQRTQELYRQYEAVFDSMAADAGALGEQIRASAAANYLRWDTLGKESGKPGGAAFSANYSDALEQVQQWLAGRAAAFAIPQTRVATSLVSGDYGTLNIRYADGTDYESVRFVLWNRSVEDSGVMWYDAVQQNGEWTASADLRFFEAAGLYQIGVYAAGFDQPVADGVNYVAGVKKNPYEMDVRLSQDKNQLTVTVKDAGQTCHSVRVLIWSTAGAQSDLQVFDGQWDGHGAWCWTVDLSGYQIEGEYNIHVFGFTEEGDQRLNATTFIR